MKLLPIEIFNRRTLHLPTSVIYRNAVRLFGFVLFLSVCCSFFVLFLNKSLCIVMKKETREKSITKSLLKFKSANCCLVWLFSLNMVYLWNNYNTKHWPHCVYRHETLQDTIASKCLYWPYPYKHLLNYTSAVTWKQIGIRTVSCIRSTNINVCIDESEQNYRQKSTPPPKKENQ